MPTYQYACTECGHAFDQVQKFSDDALTVCPVCEGKLRKVYNAVGVVFKGSGFYRNDSRGGAPSGDAPATSDSSSTEKSSGSSSEKTSEKSSTPEKKTEKKADSSAKSSGSTGSTPSTSTT